MKANWTLSGLLLLGLLLVACNQATVGPWLDESGQRLEGSQIIQYRGFEECGHQDAQFLFFFGDTYAKDPKGVLGPLTGADGSELSYVILDEVPEGVTPQGFTYGDQEIYYNLETLDDYIYIRFGGANLERWPRAEIPCDQPGS